MQFLYPLFLVAGLSLAIPILIHLFNLRRYKTVLFPHTRFLKNIQLQSRKQSQVRHRWLLALRLLFLAVLILAFAQPFFSSKKAGGDTRKAQVIYIDNSYSMSLQKGARRLLDIAKDAARQQMNSTGGSYIIITNDRPLSYTAVPAPKAIALLNTIDISQAAKTSAQVFATTQSLLQSEALPAADLYYYSDFQKSAFSAQPDVQLTKNITLHGIPVQSEAAQNIYIDTAYLTSPVLQTGQSNTLIVRSRLIGKPPTEAPILQLSMNGQVKSAATPSFNDKGESIDTLSFTPGAAGWQRMQLTINDAAVRFDDTFRIAARSTPNLSVLVLNEGPVSPYIQAAFRAYNGFQLQQESAAGSRADWKAYNLIILNGITRLDDSAARKLQLAMQDGQSVCIFPGKTTSFDALNTALKAAGDIRITGLDTAKQAATGLQQGSDLVKDIFDHVPDNVQLPTANWHYSVQAGLNANQQSVLSFRNGDPMLARYTPGKGQLYISAVSADMDGGNFPGSYFFVPFLYQMAVQSRSGDIYALTAGQSQPVHLPLNNADERNMVHALAPGIDVIPPQRPSGSGLDVFLDGAVQQGGFYTLSAAGADSVVAGLNASRTESNLTNWDLTTLKNNWQSTGATWQQPEQTAIAQSIANSGAFPLWKVCAILALLLLAAETWVLARRYSTPAPTPLS